MTELAIETRGLRRSFKTRGSTVEAVAGVDLKVTEGQIFGFLGPNGAGKTTTLRMLATLLPPSGGEASVAGCDLLLQPAEVRRLIGYVGQKGGTDGQISGYDELVLQARLHGLNAAQAATRAHDMIALLELESCAQRQTKTYSGGQKRRLDIGLGLIHRPQVLFLDEPTTGLDPQSRAHMWEEVRHMRERGTTVFLTTHYLEEADALCDTLAIIDHGRIVAQGTPDELKREVAGDVVHLRVDGDQQRLHDLLRAQPCVRELETEEDMLRLYVDRDEAAMPAILQVLHQEGFTLRTISLTQASLDDVFLKRTGRSLREAAE